MASEASAAGKECHLLSDTLNSNNTGQGWCWGCVGARGGGTGEQNPTMQELEFRNVHFSLAISSNSKPT